VKARRDFLNREASTSPHGCEMATAREPAGGNAAHALLHMKGRSRIASKRVHKGNSMLTARIFTPRSKRDAEGEALSKRFTAH
jgi:hypothetical protein